MFIHYAGQLHVIPSGRLAFSLENFKQSEVISSKKKKEAKRLPRLDGTATLSSVGAEFLMQITPF